MASEQAITEQTTEQPITDEISSTDEVLSKELNDMILQWEERLRTDKNMIAKLKTIRKNAMKLEKKKGRRTRTARTGKENGFGQPVGISAGLAEFLGVPKETLMSRTEVRKRIHEYVKSHDLRHPTDRRKFNLTLEAAKPLVKLFGVPATEEVDYFNLQRYLKSHFIKSDAPAQPATPSKDVKTKTQEALREVVAETVVEAEAPKKKTIIRKKIRPDAQEV